MGFSDQKNESFAHLDKSCTKLCHKRKPDSLLTDLSSSVGNIHVRQNTKRAKTTLEPTQLVEQRCFGKGGSRKKKLNSFTKTIEERQLEW